MAEGAKLKGYAFNKHLNGLIGNRFEMPNVSYTHPLPASKKKHMISYKEFGNIRLANIVEHIKEIQMFSDWEFMEDQWIAEVYKFTEFLRLENSPEITQSISLNFEDFENQKLVNFLKNIDIQLYPNMSAEEIFTVLGKPKKTESYVEDRITYEFLLEGKEAYYISCTVINNIGLSYLTIMNTTKSINSLKNK